MGIGPDIMALSDGDLVAALAIIRDGPGEATKLSDWERTFVESLPRIWERHGTITWKQRKYSRELLAKIEARLKRRAEVRRLTARAGG